MSDVSSNGLPGGWVQCTLGALVAPTRPRVSPSEHADDPFVGMEHIEAHTMKLLGTVPAGTMKSSSVRFHPGDVLYGRLRPYLNKVFRADFDGLCSAEFIVLPEREHLDSRFLQYRLNAMDFVRFASSLNTGDRPRVDFDQVSVFPVRVPPVAEQRRIVAEIEKQFSRLDAGVAALKRVEANLRRYKAAVLKAACDGSLSAPWRAAHPDAEPADRLLARILRERRRRWEEAELAKLIAKGKPPKDDRWKQRYKEPAPPRTAGLPELPPTWCWATVEQLTCFVTSGSRGWAEFYADSGSIFIRAQDINTDRLRLNSVAHVRPPAGAEGDRTRVRRNDLLITITGANVTKSALVDQDLEDAHVSQHVALARPVVEATASYQYLWIVSTAHGRRVLEKLAYGAGKPGLNLDNIRELPVALPPIEEQAAITETVDDTWTIVQSVEQTVEVNLKRADRLRQSTLKAAFEGRLVAQDPSDEPAAALLERMRARRGDGKPQRAIRRESIAGRRGRS